MNAQRALLPLALALVSVPLGAHPRRPPAAGAHPVAVSVEIEDREVPLLAAVDGSGRFYVEATKGGRYAVRLRNRSAFRVAVLLAVDGLNVVSGTREPGPAAGRPGRMYVLEAWDEVLVRGWRTSLEEVRRFTFVDERVSYAARTGQSNERMGWIEAWVYREQGRARAAVQPPATAKAAPTPHAEREADAARDQAAGRAEESYPGTGWGAAEDDHARLVRVRPERWPVQSVVLRYEYAPALRALGLLPTPPQRDRLRERERGDGFARPPAW